MTLVVVSASDMDAVLGSGASTEGNEWTLGQLTRLLGAVPRRQAEYEETYYSSLLKEPLKTKGKLTFAAPSTVEKHVLEPFEERYRVDGEMLIMEKQPKGTPRTVSLDDYPPLRAFVEGFRAVLSGDLESLKQFYDVRLEGEQSSWALTLMPLEDSVHELVEVLRFVGKEDSFTSIEIWEPNGDHSKMVITRQWK